MATYRASDSTPKEQFYYHAAGYGEVARHGGSSYIDSMLLRDRDMTSGWSGGVDGTLEDRVYYGQNWRADVSGVTSACVEHVEADRLLQCVCVVHEGGDPRVIQRAGGVMNLGVPTSRIRL